MTPQPTLARDPVCGMTVEPAKAKAQGEHAGQTYYFCCTGCAQKFQSNPEEYLKAKTPKPELVTLGGLTTRSVKPAQRKTPAKPIAQSEHKPVPTYVCPMCPEVRESKPGACPSCGMALEPEVPAALTKTENT